MVPGYPIQQVGYLSDFNNGLIIQFGYKQITGTAGLSTTSKQIDINYPITFQQIFSVTLSSGNNKVKITWGAYKTNLNKLLTFANTYSGTSSDYNCTYIAVGY